MTPADDLHITLTWNLRNWRPQKTLVHAARHAAAAEGFKRGALSLVVVGARAMRTLHARYMGTAEVTDVLSFDLGTDVAAGMLEAEIVVCADVARRRARQRDKAARAVVAELALYVVHGILHQAGYDDHDDAGYRRMHAREDALLRELGLGAVFGDG